MVVAVTGGTGFVGRHLARELARRGRRVRALDLTPRGEAPFPWGLGGLSGVEFLRADVRDRGALGPALRGATAVVHLAGLASLRRSREDRLEAFRANALGTANVLDAAREMGVRRVLITSSRKVTETSADAYALTKAIAEQWTGLYAREFAGGVVVVRLSNVYGPGQDAGAVVPDFLEKAAVGRPPYDGGPPESVPLVYVDDVAAALVVLLEAGEVGGVVTITGGEDVALADLAGFVSALAREEGAAGPAHAPPATATAATDPRLAGLGWTPRVHWIEGVRRSWAAWRTHLIAGRVGPA